MSTSVDLLRKYVRDIDRPHLSKGSTTNPSTGRRGFVISGRSLTFMAGTRNRERSNWCPTSTKPPWTWLRNWETTNYTIMTCWSSCWVTGLIQPRECRRSAVNSMVDLIATMKKHTHLLMLLQSCARWGIYRVHRNWDRNWSRSSSSEVNRTRN